MAGPALLICALAACSDSESRGPTPASEGEQAALDDAAEMLSERPEDGGDASAQPDATD
ncbi:hypothetical protein [Aurantiacibacter gangjinensis]|uniref:hypothetical protein n=1 Tax=Aurantiacibacter gangjinensis TaxID=502682 RepID=UPI00090B012F|nr:hypothetical protein [Aurantiacibacter gangjinensis]APE27298.1 hypothetical protein BMF35_a0469 [Aurantiacibacter gangjinensis]